MIRHTSARCFLLILLWPATGSAQTGSIRGSVVDQTDLVLPGAPGTYTLTVSLGGFSDATVEDVVVSGTALALPPVELQLASFGETVVVTASRSEVRLLDAPVSTSVISASTLETTPAQNFGDLLRATPGVNVIQLSARDVQVTSRSPGNTLTNSQLVLVDGRSAYLDFFGLVLWDLLPTNFDDVEQIEVVRGPASAVWGANAMTGAVNIITKPPRESVGTTVTLSGGYVDRQDGSGTGLGAGSLFGANATVTRAPSDRLAYRISAGYFTSDAFARPTGRIPVIDDPRQPGQTVGGAFYPLDSAAAAFGTGFANRGTSQPKFDVRVDQELSHGTLTYAGGVAGTDGLVHSGIGPFDMQTGTYLGYGKLTYTRGGLLSQEIGLNVAPAVELLGNSNDRASRCDEFITPRFAEIPGCGSGRRSTFSAMRLARRWSNGASWWRAANRRASLPTGSANTSGPAPVPPSPPSMAMQSTPRVPVARSGARSVQKVASPTAALLPTGSPIAAAMDSTKSSRASAFPKALGAVEMATGTGKTRTAVAFVKRLFEAGVVTRVLFPRRSHRTSGTGRGCVHGPSSRRPPPRVVPRAKNERLETGPTKRDRLHSLPPTMPLPQNPSCSPLTMVSK